MQTHEQQTFDVAVYIGRFQPFHNGHLATCLHALTRAKKLIILVGSAMIGPMPKNPWSFIEISTMIQGALSPEAQARTQIHPLLDSVFDDRAWVKRVHRLVASQTKPKQSVALMGFAKDISSAYLDWFADWHWIHQPMIPIPNTDQSLDATLIRRCLWERRTLPQGCLPASSATGVATLLAESRYQALKAAYQWQKTYEKQHHITYVVILERLHHVAFSIRQEPLGFGQKALPTFISQEACMQWIHRLGLVDHHANLWDQRAVLLDTQYHVYHFKVQANFVADEFNWIASDQLVKEILFADHRSLLYQPLKLKY